MDDGRDRAGVVGVGVKIKKSGNVEITALEINRSLF